MAVMTIDRIDDRMRAARRVPHRYARAGSELYERLLAEALGPGYEVRCGTCGLYPECHRGDWWRVPLRRAAQALARRMEG